MPGKRRILYVESSKGGVGGSHISLLTLIRHLDASRYEPHLLMLGDNQARGDFTAAGCHVHLWDDADLLDENRAMRDAAAMARPAVRGAGLNGLYALIAGVVRFAVNDLPLALRLAELASEIGADLVHANDRVHSNAFAIHGARLAGLPVLVHERLLYSYTWTDRLASRGVDLLCCITEAVRDSARRQGAAPRRTAVIYNPVELGPPAGLSRTLRRITFVGRLVPWKGVAEFIEACGLLAGRFEDLEFKVVGGGAPGDTYPDRLRRQAKSLGLGARIRFTGMVRDVSAVLEQTDILIHASITPEPFGRTVAEGMAHGLPVIATDHGGPPEFMENGRTGLLVEPGSPRAIAEAVAWLMGHPEAARRMGRCARASAERLFSPQAHVRRISSLYERFLGGQAARTGG
ncbi:MAG: glycosyltransferase family 4 protein [Acidobacteriota bacterium]